MLRRIHLIVLAVCSLAGFCDSTTAFALPVGKTEAAEQSALVQVMTEFQDVIYPGPTYVLRYDRAQDVLQGS